MTRWFVQIDARFASVWPLAVEEAVAERLDRAGLLLDRDNGVLGDPGPILCAHLVMEAAEGDEAAAAGWCAYHDALEAAGAEGYVHERTVTVAMAEIERRQEEARAWFEAHVPRFEPGDEPQAFDHVVLRDDLRRLPDP